VDPVDQWLDSIAGKALSKDELRASLAEAHSKSAVYLRPETAQAMFVQFLNVQQSTSQKVPFGIAQIGKSFRNEIITEHFVFRSCEFEQMEMEFFCEPGTQSEWLDYWKNERISWFQKYANEAEHFRLREHDKDELAHYSDACYDVEYLYPWGWDELEGVASRTDYDLAKHAKATGTKLSYFDQNKENPETGKKGWRYIPYVIEPAAGLTRAFYCFLLDAYHEEQSTDAKGNPKTRVLLKLHPRLAPYQVAVLPLLRKDGHPEKAEQLSQSLRASGLRVSYDEVSSIGKRYAKHDEVGTPFCVTIDGETLEGKGVTVRDRDSSEQLRVSEDELEQWIWNKIREQSVEKGS
jgi:glycyl-tRNA synthetase